MQISRRIFLAGAASLIALRPALSADYTPPLSEVLVRNRVELANALLAAKPGTHIVLADGIYTGNFTQAAAGSPGAQIVVRAQNLLGAVIDGTLALKGPFSVAHGLAFTNPATVYGIGIMADDVHVLRCHFRSAKGATLSTAKRFRIGYCHFSGNPIGTAKADHVWVNVPDGGTNVPSGLIDRNHFRHTKTTDASESHHVYVGNSYSGDPAKTPNLPDLIIEYNLIEGSSMRRGIYVKRGCIIQFNKMNMKRGICLIRDGGDGKVLGNHMVGMKSAVINGPNHQVRGNYWRNTRFECSAEYRTGSGSYHRAADNSVFAGNDGVLHVGFVETGGTLIRPVSGVQVYANKGQVNLLKQVNTLVSPTGDGQQVPAVVSLSRSQVGPAGV